MVSVADQFHALAAPAKTQHAAFTRPELALILSLYGQFVAAGEWRDYAIDHLPDAAVFSVFRHAAEAPLYRIEKHPRLAVRQGAWMVVSMSGAILRRGHDLGLVLRVFDRARMRLVLAPARQANKGSR